MGKVKSGCLEVDSLRFLWDSNVESLEKHLDICTRSLEERSALQIWNKGGRRQIIAIQMETEALSVLKESRGELEQISGKPLRNASS